MLSRCRTRQTNPKSTAAAATAKVHQPSGRLTSESACYSSIVNRDLLLCKLQDIENSVRCSLKVFGLRLDQVTKRSFEARVVELVAVHTNIAAITESSLRVRRVLLDELCRLDRMARTAARKDPVCRRLTTVLGVGVIVALTYRTGIDLPERFTRSRDVGAHFGLAPRRYSAGQVDYDGHISRCGDEMVRTALYQAAHVLMHHGRWSALCGWAVRIAKRTSASLRRSLSPANSPWSYIACGSTEPTSAGQPTSRHWQ